MAILNQIYPVNLQQKQRFIGRTQEKSRLTEIGRKNKAQIVVVYGRRRVGKTELIEQTYASRNLLKFEGLERQDTKSQLKEFIRTLVKYTKNEELYERKINSWAGAFDLLAHYVVKGKWTIYLEELQWMANYGTELISSLKSIWDNSLRHNPDLVVVLCGSAPSFMIRKVLHSSALYNRSEINFPLRPFTLPEVREFFGQDRSIHEIMDAVLTVGALPPYLELLRDSPSVYLGLAAHSFKKDSYFSYEYRRIFTSSLAKNPAYKAILEYLANQPFATRAQIAQQINKKTGGVLTTLLEDLEESGFIFAYSTPGSARKGRGRRYELSDPFIRWYVKWIQPNFSEIDKGAFDRNPQLAMDTSSLRPWLGYSFERWLRQQPFLISRLLGFDGIRYKSGSYYEKDSNKNFQIDLLYERADKVTTIVEIKYKEKPVGVEVIEEVEEKIGLYRKKFPRKSIQKVLLSSKGANPELVSRGYFDVVLALEDLFKPEIW